MKSYKVSNHRQMPSIKKLDRQLKKASMMYEKQFLRQMVKAMRNSVSHSALTKPGMAENIYREQLDEKYVDNWVQRGGTGFGDMIYKDLVDKFFPQLGPKRVKSIRSMNISDRFQGMEKVKHSPNKSEQTFNIELAPQTKSESLLKIPWQGRLEKQFALENGQKVMMFSHPFGLQSTFVFRGQLEPGLLGKTLMDGENFAQLAPQGQKITWSIKDSSSRKDSSDLKNNSFN